MPASAAKPGGEEGCDLQGVVGTSEEMLVGPRHVHH